jgi:hypothetical protein
MTNADVRSYYDDILEAYSGFLKPSVGLFMEISGHRHNDEFL